MWQEIEAYCGHKKKSQSTYMGDDAYKQEVRKAS